MNIKSIINNFDLLSITNEEYATNVAITIKGIYTSLELIKSINFDKDSLSYFIKQTVISSYSVVEAITSFIGYKIQYSCINCNKKNNCLLYSDSIFLNTKKASINYIRSNAEDYLKSVHILDFENGFEDYYNAYRKTRNGVHLAASTTCISNDSNYTLHTLRNAVAFMEHYIKVEIKNYKYFIKAHSCPIKKYYGALFSNIKFS